MPNKKPNILLVIADDHTYRDSGCYGNQDVKTPNIDKLASEGMRFTRCFTATAMCAPTRQQLYTGIFPVKNGAYPNHSHVKKGTKSIVHYLRDLGYRVGLSGKTHFGPRESFPFERVSKKNIDFEAVREFINRDKQEPYCLIVASHNPHVPWNQGDASAYNPEKITVPPYMVDTSETRQALCRYYAEVTELDCELGECMKLVDGSGMKENTMFVYTSEQGMQTPYAKWTCYDLGLRTAFVVRWPEKIKSGTVSDAMIQYVDFVPTCIEAAGGEPLASDCSRRYKFSVDGRSFLSVLLGETDDHRDYVYGVHTTNGIIVGRPYPVRSIRSKTHKYIMNLMPDETFNNVMIERDRENFWKSWVKKAESDEFAKRRVELYLNRPAEEFYDIVEDPHELNNLAGEPQYRPLMNSMRKKLEYWMKEQGDEGITTEMKAPERQ